MIPKGRIGESSPHTPYQRAPIQIIIAIDLLAVLLAVHQSCFSPFLDESQNLVLSSGQTILSVSVQHSRIDIIDSPLIE